METRLIRVHYYDDINEQNDVEEILCEKVADNIYRLIEIPLWAYSLAFGDIIFVSNDGHRDWLAFDKFCQFSNNSTIQLVEMQKNGLGQVLPKIKEIIGEDNLRFNSPTYIAINVPAQIDYLPLKNFLMKMEQKNIIGFKEASLAPQHRPKE